MGLFILSAKSRPNKFIITNTRFIQKRRRYSLYACFSQHIPEFLRSLKEKNLSLRFFSVSSIEKKNHDQVKFKQLNDQTNLSSILTLFNLGSAILWWNYNGWWD